MASTVFVKKILIHLIVLIIIQKLNGENIRNCAVETSDYSFDCSERGRFVNLNDLTCTTYYLCSLLRNGSFIKTQYTCPQGSYFDGDNHLCTTTYICPCSQPSTTTELVSTTEVITTTTTTTPKPTTTKITTTSKPTRNCNVLETEDYNFTCTERGRFINLNDLTCTTYYLCSLLRNGSFIKTQYNCPDGSYFDEDTHLCTTTYICPCSSPTTINIITTTSKVTTKTTKLPEITTTVKPTTSEITTTSKPVRNCTVPKAGEYNFTCTERGRFINLNDLTCTTYYLCSLLRNGSFIKTQYNCPDGSYFDEDTHLCTTTYICPCSSPTTINIITTTSKVTTKTTKLPEITTTVKPTTSEITTTSKPVRNCTVPKAGEYNFTCTERGRFINLNDLTCTTYYLCSLLRNGSFIRTQYNCPQGSYFDGDNHLCTTTYICPCSQPSTTTELVSTTEVITTTTTTTPKPTTTKITTTSKPTRNCNVLETEDYNFTCTERGRFINLNDLTCTTYYLCSLLRNGSFIRTQYNCPDGSYFDEDAHLCTTTYICPCSNPTTTQSITTTKVTTEPTKLPEITTTVKPTTSEIITTSKPGRNCTINEIAKYNFTCSERGRFINLNDLTCTTYYLCSLLRNGSFIKTQYNCPDGSYFDEDAHLCTTTYICPCTTPTTIQPITTTSKVTTKLTTTPETTTTLKSTTFKTTTTSKPVRNCTIPETEEYNFTCTERGRFINLNDLTCSTYYLCSLLRNGSFIKTQYNCPDGSYFDEDAHLCTTTYICPCSNPTTIQLISTTTEVTTKFTTPTEITTTVKPTTSEIITTSKPGRNCTVSEIGEYNFTCSERGRFINLNDLTCTTYYLCSLLRNGSFIRTRYNCPEGSYFDEDAHLCTTAYICPCSSPTTIQLITTSTEPTTQSTTPVEITTTMKPTTSEIITTFKPVRNCTIPDSEDYFNCTERGRFVNLNDLTCTSYYLCSLLTNGSFIKTQYNCPTGSYFDEDAHLCTTTYICPCTTPTTIQPITTTTDVTSKPTTLPEITTTLKPITSEIITTSKPGRNCTILKTGEYNFTCSERGRFINLNDLTCTTYYLCSLLRNGSFIKTQYNCPDGSYFDEDAHLCTTAYICPCSNPTTTQLITTTSEVTTELTKLPEITTTVKPTTSEITTTSKPVRNCTIPKTGQYNFTCSERGRFINLNDLTCTTYYLCSLLRNGSFIKTQYNCPDGSYFDEDAHLCTTTYICPCITKTTSENLITTQNVFITASSTSVSTELGSTFSTDIISTTQSDVNEMSTRPSQFDLNCLDSNTNNFTCKSNDGKQIYFQCIPIQNQYIIY